MHTPSPTPTTRGVRPYYRNFDLKLFYNDPYLDPHAWVEAIGLPGERTDPELLKLPEHEIHDDLQRFKAGEADRRSCERIGAALFDALFPLSIRESWRRHQGLMLPESILRLRLDIRHPKLASIPWETLHDDHALVMSPRQPVVRCPKTGPIVDPVRHVASLSILLVTSSPKGMPDVSVRREVASIKKSLNPLLQEGTLTIEVLESPSLKGLQTKLKQHYDVLHYIGHGEFREGAGYLILQQEGTRHRQMVDGRTLGHFLLGGRIRLLVLNACETATPSQVDPLMSLADAALAAGVPAAVAMQGAVADELAVAFAEMFYRSLAQGDPLETCMTDGRRAMVAGRPQRADWALPVLFSYLPDGILWDFDHTKGTPASEGTATRTLPRLPGIERTPVVRHRSSRPVRHNLIPIPRDYRQLVGREQELSRIMEALDPASDKQLITLTGDPGVGCTALAREVAQRCLDRSIADPLNPGAFAGVIWASRRQTVLAPTEDLQGRPHAQWNLNDVYITVASTLKQPVLLQARPEERMAVLRDVLHEARYLLVLDGFDELRDRERNDFLYFLFGLRHVHGPTKAILTGHRLLGVDGLEDELEAITLTGLPEWEALQLLTHEAQEAGCEALEKASDAELSRLAQKSHRLPLVLLWAMGQLRHSGQPLEWVFELLESRDQQPLAEFCFSRSVGQLNEDQQRLLLAIALFPQPTGVEAAGSAAGLEGSLLVEALERLRRLRLAQLDGAQRIHIPPRVRRFAINRLQADEALRKRMTAAAVATTYRTVQAAHRRADQAGREYLESELGNILWAARQAYEREAHRTVLAFRNGLHEFMFQQRYFNEGIKLGEWAADSADQLGLPEQRAWCALYPIGRLHFHQDRYTDAQRWCKLGLSLFKQLQHEHGMATAERYLGRVMQARHRLDEAERLFASGLRRAKRISSRPSDLQGHLIASLAGLSQARGDYAEAKRAFDQALMLYRQTGNWEGIAATLRSLAEIALVEERYEETDQRLKESLAIAKGRDWPAGRAKILYVQACSAEAQGQLTRARNLLGKAHEAFYELSDVPGLVRTDAVLARVSAAMSQATGTEAQ